MKTGIKRLFQPSITNEITTTALYSADCITAYESFPIAIEALMNDAVDAVVIDRPA